MPVRSHMSRFPFVTIGYSVVLCPHYYLTTLSIELQVPSFGIL